MRKRFYVTTLFVFACAGLIFAEVTESTWKALLDSVVTITKTDGTEVSGTLKLIEANSVSVIKSDGEVVTVQKKDVRDVRARSATTSSSSAVAQNTLGNPSPGWAMSAGVVGFVAGGLGLALGVAAIATNGNGTDTPTILGAADLLLVGATFPIVAAGGSSARNGGISRSPALRITGWTAWGLTLLDGIVEVGLGAAGYYIPDSVVASTVILGVAALACISTDAVLSAQAAVAAQKASAQTLQESGPSLAVAPLVRLEPNPLSKGYDTQLGMQCLVRY